LIDPANKSAEKGSRGYAAADAPFLDISSHLVGCVRMSSSASATAASSVGSTTTPWCSVFMMSTGPPLRVATVGTPCAAAYINDGLDISDSACMSLERVHCARTLTNKSVRTTSNSLSLKASSHL